MHVDAAVLVLAELGLEGGDELAEGLLLVGHDLGEEERVEQAVALREMAADADAAGLFAADQDLLREHEVADVLEADAVLVQFAAVFGGDAVQHFGGVEGAGDVAGPAFVLEQPLENDGEDLVRVDDVAVLVDGADAVGVAIGDEAGVAVLGDDAALGLGDVGEDGLGVDAGKGGVDLGPHLDEGDARAGEDAGEHAAAGAVHAVDEEAVAGGADGWQIDELLDRADVVGGEVDLGDGGRDGGGGQRFLEVGLDGADDGGRAGAAVARLVLDAVPLWRVMAGGDHDAAGVFALADSEGEGGRGGDFVGEGDGDAGVAEDFSDDLGEGARAEAGVIGDGDAGRGVFLLEDVVRDGGGGDADVGEGEVVGDDAAPAVGAEFDDSLGCFRGFPGCWDGCCFTHVCRRLFYEVCGADFGAR